MHYYYYYYYYYYYFNVIRVSYFTNVFYPGMVLKESKHVRSLMFSVKNIGLNSILKKFPEFAGIIKGIATLGEL
jgi:hypothetical protein